MRTPEAGAACTVLKKTYQRRKANPVEVTTDETREVTVKREDDADEKHTCVIESAEIDATERDNTSTSELEIKENGRDKEMGTFEGRWEGSGKDTSQRDYTQPRRDQYLGDEGLHNYGDRIDFVEEEDPDEEDPDEEDPQEEDPEEFPQEDDDMEEPAQETQSPEEHDELAAAEKRKIKKQHEIFGDNVLHESGDRIDFESPKEEDPDEEDPQEEDPEEVPQGQGYDDMEEPAEETQSWEEHDELAAAAKKRKIEKEHGIGDEDLHDYSDRIDFEYDELPAAAKKRKIKEHEIEDEGLHEYGDRIDFEYPEEEDLEEEDPEMEDPQEEDPEEDPQENNEMEEPAEETKSQKAHDEIAAAAVNCIKGVNDTEFSDGNTKTRLKARLSNLLPKTQAIKGGMCGGFRIDQDQTRTFSRFEGGFSRGGHGQNSRMLPMEYEPTWDDQEGLEDQQGDDQEGLEDQQGDDQEGLEDQQGDDQEGLEDQQGDDQEGLEDQQGDDQEGSKIVKQCKGRGYALPKQKIPLVDRKQVTIYENILRPDDIPHWFAPEIRLRISGFWESFEKTPPGFRADIWKAFKQYYTISEHLHEAVHKLFLEQLSSCYKNFVTRMKARALKKANLQRPSPELINVRPPFLKNRPRLWKQWVDYWCSPKQLKLSETNSKNRKAHNGGMGTHAGGSRSHSRSVCQILDETGEKLSVAKRLKLQYGKKDDSGNATSEFVNPLSSKIMEEWKEAVKAKHGEDADPETINDPDLYLSLPTVKSRKKKGILIGTGLAKHSHKSTRGSSSQGSNSHVLDHDIAKFLLEEKEKMTKKIEMLEKVVKHLAQHVKSDLAVQISSGEK